MNKSPGDQGAPSADELRDGQIVQLLRAKEAAEAANLAKSRYIVGISHEIRAPLNAISGYAQLIERDPEAPIEDAIRVIRRSATHLADLVDGLLDIARLENGAVHIERGRVNLPDLLEQVVDMFRLQAKAKGVVFRFEQAGLPAFVYTDEKRLRQILINLLSNAIKYTDAGHVGLRVAWRAEIAEFEITDTGPGIATEDLERIFEPFHRLAAQAGAKPGIGLGLTITKLLTTVLGGEIQVESTLGAGSTFRVKLMLAEAAAPAPSRPPAHRIASYRSRRRRVLMIDDDPTHLALLRRFLAPLDLDLHEASDGEGGLAVARAHRPDLVILDVSMPGIDGWETARRLRGMLGETVAILMASANAHDFSRARLEDDPHDDFLIKPYEADVLIERVEALLDLARPPAEAVAE